MKAQTGHVRNSRWKQLGKARPLASCTLPTDVLIRMFQVPCGPNKTSSQRPSLTWVCDPCNYGDDAPEKHLEQIDWLRFAFQKDCPGSSAQGGWKGCGSPGLVTLRERSQEALFSCERRIGVRKWLIIT